MHFVFTFCTVDGVVMVKGKGLYALKIMLVVFFSIRQRSVISIECEYILHISYTVSAAIAQATIASISTICGSITTVCTIATIDS